VTRAPTVRYETILWDLDGTLTDPKPGITRSVQHALRELGVEVADADTLTPYIGPPLREGFARHHGIPEHQLEDAVLHYRARFTDVGLYENAVIDGVPELLARLRADGRRMAIATAKPEAQALLVLEHFGLLELFDVVGAATLDTTRITKDDVIEYTLELLGISDDAPARAATVMIGDREHDILGGQAHGLATIAVTWGYAADGELEAAKPDATASTIPGLAHVLGIGAKPQTA
jgi:phosphoglycolate phosphatase